jgi:ABC-type Fe3+ transport system permease subunit
MSENPFSSPTASTIPERPSFWRAVGRGFFWGGLVSLGLFLSLAIAAAAVARFRDGEAIPNFLALTISGMPGAVLTGGLIGSLVALARRWIVPSVRGNETQRFPDYE